jgi:vacuolar-type H+-ATPase subunit I/STV1
MIDGSAILDRAVISTLISKLAQEQQELVTSLTKTETSSSSSSSDYRTWLRILSEMENEKTVLQELLKKAEKVSAADRFILRNWIWKKVLIVWIFRSLID